MPVLERSCPKTLPSSKESPTPIPNLREVESWKSVKPLLVALCRDDVVM